MTMSTFTKTSGGSNKGYVIARVHQDGTPAHLLRLYGALDRRPQLMLTDDNIDEEFDKLDRAKSRTYDRHLPTDEYSATIVDWSKGGRDQALSWMAETIARDCPWSLSSSFLKQKLSELETGDIPVDELEAEDVFRTKSQRQEARREVESLPNWGAF